MNKHLKPNINWVIAVLTLGFTSLITQNILLREFLSVFHGNELVIGIILTNWMLLTGLGAYTGRFFEHVKRKKTWLLTTFVFMGLLPVITAFLINYFRNIVFPGGSMAGIVQVLYLSFLFLLPFCMLTGSFFTLLSIVISNHYKANLISKVYANEALGSIIGGLFFNFLLIYLFDAFNSLLVLLAINSLMAMIIAFYLRSNAVKIVSGLLIAGSIIAIAFANPGQTAKSYLYKNQELLYQKDTPYGNIAVTRVSGQYNFYENNQLLFSTNNQQQNEENTHYAMVQHPDPQKVLLISGGVTGIVDEVAKYNVQQIDYVELNPWLIKAGRKFTDHLTNEKLHIINKDARLYIKQTNKHYDVILVNLPSPSNANINRFYTIEFFHALKEKTTENGVVMISATGAGNYMSKEVTKSLSVIYKTFAQAFTNVLIVPGGQTYLIGSEDALSPDIPGLIAEKNIETVYVNEFYLDAAELARRSSQITNSLSAGAPVNKDFNPVAYFMQVRYWMSFFQFRAWMLAGLLAGLVVFFWIRLKPVGLGMFAAGFTGASIEIVLLMAFQVIYGYVYHIIGLIITVFMAGLAAGSLYYYKIMPVINMKKFRNLQFSLGGMSVLILLILYLFSIFKPNMVLVHAFIFALMFITAGLIGMVFSMAAKLNQAGIAQATGETYSADLIGAAIGSLVMSVFLIPLLGIINVLFLVGGLSILSGIMIKIKC